MYDLLTNAFAFYLFVGAMILNFSILPLLIVEYDSVWTFSERDWQAELQWTMRRSAVKLLLCGHLKRRCTQLFCIERCDIAKMDFKPIFWNNINLQINCVQRCVRHCIGACKRFELTNVQEHNSFVSGRVMEKWFVILLSYTSFFSHSPVFLY